MKVVGSRQWFRKENHVGVTNKKEQVCVQSIVDAYKHPFISGGLTCPACLYPFSVHGMITEDQRNGFENGTVYYDRHTMYGVVCPGDTINKLENGRYKILKPARRGCKQVEMM